MDRRTFCISALLFFVFAFSVRSQEIVAHDLLVSISPEKRHIQVEDTLSLKGKGPYVFLLNGNLALTALQAPFVLKSSEIIGDVQQYGINAYFPDISSRIALRRYEIVLPPEIQVPEENRVKIAYQGEIHYPIEQVGTEHVRSFQETPGIISKEGVYLSGSSFWYPVQPRTMVRSRIDVRVPNGWMALSQGKNLDSRTEGDFRHTTWDNPWLTDEIYLVAGPWIEYQKKSGAVSCLVYLRKKEDALAGRYLEATAQYIAMYSRLIGEYPYTQFALVENFWETGYGMPSFTLLGPSIIRFPFILHTSYPHEILHNWWGNGVFVEYASGNWCEGLTAYMADHLLQEQKGAGAEYRRQILQKYRDFVRQNDDFPLTQFRSRHSPATEAVGYGKSAMFFHELRNHLGDTLFIEGIRRFYRQFQFRSASFNDLRDVFSEVSKKDLGKFVQERVERKGAPEISLSKVKKSASGEKTLLQFSLEQKGELFSTLDVPIVITLENGRAEKTIVRLDEKVKPVAVFLSGTPVRLDVDPHFDVFRRLSRAELPPSIGQIFGAGEMALILPSLASQEEKERYENMARAWAKGKKAEVFFDGELKEFPKDRSAWIFGERNRFAPREWLQFLGVSFDEKGISSPHTGKIPWKGHSIVLTLAHPVHEEMALGWVVADPPEAIPGLTRKLPHYGKYGYLAFEGKEPENTVKGAWPVISSPMTFTFGGPSPMGKVEERKPLAEPISSFSEERMMGHVRILASDRFRGRGIGTAEIDEAADYLAKEYAGYGLSPGGENRSFFQRWQQKSGPDGREMTLQNVVGILPGKQDLPPVVIGAHYDHLGLGWPGVKKGNEGKIHPGADDNASGIAVLLETARFFAERGGCKRPLFFVAFTGEEAGRLGSKYFVSQSKGPFLGMINLDTVGRLREKISLFGSESAREWAPMFRGCGFVVGTSVAIVAEELDSSDQVSFLEKGIPAVQLCTGAHLDYHTPQDTADKIDPAGLLRVASLLKEAVEYLGEREAPLTATVKTHEDKTGPLPVHPERKKRSGLGIVPDFTYSEKGVRITGTVPGSPAEKIGLKSGDVLLGLGTFEIGGMKDLAAALRSCASGVKLPLRYTRNGTLEETEVTLEEK